MSNTIVLMPEIVEMPLDELRKYAFGRAETIARATPGDSDSWDDPEEWQGAAAELAHAFIRLCSEAGADEPTADTLPQSRLNGCRNPVFVTGGARAVGATGTHRAWIDLTGYSLDGALVRCTHQDLAEVGFREWLSVDLATRFESAAVIRLEVVA